MYRDNGNDIFIRHKHFERAENFIKFRAPNPYRFKRYQIREKQKMDSPIIQEVIDHFPDTGGVYFLFDYEYHIIYIGQSINLKRRMKEHLNPNCKNSNVSEIPFTDVAFYPIVDDPTRIFMESFYIYYYDPTYNYSLYQQIAYDSRAFVKKGANYFKYATTQDVIDLQLFLSFIGEENLTRIYGKILFSHPDKFWWKVIQCAGLSILENDNAYLRDRMKDENDFSPLNCYYSRFLKAIMKHFFDKFKETYTFQYEIGLLNEKEVI